MADSPKQYNNYKKRGPVVPTTDALGRLSPSRRGPAAVRRGRRQPLPGHRQDLL